MLLGVRRLVRGEPVPVVASGIIRAVIGAYLDWIGGRVDALPSVGRALVQVLATVVLVTVLANLLRWAGFRLALRVPDAAQSSFRRDRRATTVAAELLPDVGRARSVLAGNYGDRPPETSGPSIRGWREARELQGAADEQELARWAWLARAEERLIETVSRTTTFFGASSLSAFRPLGRPATVLVSAALVLWVRPPWQLPSVGTIADSVATAVDARPGRVLPFALLALGLWMVARPFPVVDRIRARDEAAKDANKLLAEMYGQLTQLSYVLYQWREELLTGRHDRVASYVEEVTHGRHSWGPGGGLIAAGHVVPFRRTGGRFPGPEVVGGRLTAHIEAIETLDASIRDKGLVVVARRLTWRVRYPLGELGLLRPLGLNSGLRRATCAPSALYAPNLAMVAAVEPRTPGKTEVLPVLDDHLLDRIESEAFNYARVLDMSIAKVILCEAQIQRVARYLGSRMVGSWWTRTLSLVQK
ncbi:hypothetical protein [Modestobacter sp. URMC 112]